jgi:Tfp pilus assembly protein FimT
MKRTRDRGGFTLFEVLLVMAIIIIMMSVAIPTIQSWYGDSRVKGAADDIRGAWAEARAHAIDEGVNYRFAVNYDTGRFKVGPDDSDHWENSDDSQDADSTTGTGPLTLRKTIAKGIKFTRPPDFNTAPDANGWTTLINFLPDGTCKEDSTTVINADGFPTITLRMRGLTGTATTE